MSFKFLHRTVGDEQESRFYSLLTLFSELRLDGFVHFVGGDHAGDALDLLAVARDKDAGRIAKKAAEFVRSIIVANKDGIAHGELLAVNVKTLLADERSNDASAFFVQRDSENHESLVAVFLLHFDQPRNFDAARFAPRGPEIHKHDLTFVLTEGDVLSVEVF